MLSRTKQNGRNCEMHLVDETRLEILPDCRRSASEPHVFAVRSVCRTPEGGVNAIGNEVERGAAIHGDWIARVAGKHEHWGVVRRVFTPPTFPSAVQPGSP